VQWWLFCYVWRNWQMDRQRDGRTDMTALKGEFRDYVNSPKMVNDNDVNLASKRTWRLKNCKVSEDLVTPISLDYSKASHMHRVHKTCHPCPAYSNWNMLLKSVNRKTDNWTKYFYRNQCFIKMWESEKCRKW